MQYAVVTFTSLDIEVWQKDLLISDLADFGFDTFEDQNKGFKAYIPSAQLDIQALETLLLQQTEGYTIDYVWEEIPHQNWNELWESNFNPIVVGEQCYVRAKFHQPQPQYQYELVIQPKMAFGTGHHQTTSMMLSFILENNLKDKTVLDMGCGTGILAILCSKKGAKDMIAIDSDPVCIESVEENCLINNTPNVSGYIGSIEQAEDMRFDIILANINRNIILEQLPSYIRTLNDQGELYLSGFYDTEDFSDIEEQALTLGLSFLEKKTMDNWCAARFVKK